VAKAFDPFVSGYAEVYRVPPGTGPKALKEAGEHPDQLEAKRLVYQKLY
jgi:hypothetical protein